MSNQLFQTIIALSLFIFIGYGLTSLCLPKQLRHLQTWLSAWLGIVLIIDFSFAFSLAKRTIGQEFLIPQLTAGYLIVIIGLLACIVSALNRNIHPPTKRDILILGVLIIISLGLKLNPVPSLTAITDMAMNNTVLITNYLEVVDKQISTIGYALPSTFIAHILSIDTKRAVEIFSQVIGILFIPTIIAYIYQIFNASNKRVTSAVIFLTAGIVSGICGFQFGYVGVLFLFGILSTWVLLFEAFSLQTTQVQLFSLRGSELLMGLLFAGILIIDFQLFWLVLALSLLYCFFAHERQTSTLYLLKIVLLALFINPFVLGYIV